MLIFWRGLKGDFTELYLLHLICVSSEKEKDVAFFSLSFSMALELAFRLHNLFGVQECSWKRKNIFDSYSVASEIE